MLSPRLNVDPSATPGRPRFLQDPTYRPNLSYLRCVPWTLRPVVSFVVFPLPLHPHAPPRHLRDRSLTPRAPSVAHAQLFKGSIIRGFLFSSTFSCPVADARPREKCHTTPFRATLLRRAHRRDATCVRTKIQAYHAGKLPEAC